MFIYQKHIFKHLLHLFILICVVCTGIVWLSQALKFIPLLTKGIKLTTFLSLTFLTLPSLLLTIIPISLFLCTIYFYNKIKHDREMVVMENGGLGYRSIAKPAIYLSLIMTLLCYLISLYLLPLSYGKLKSKLETLKEGYTTSLLHAQTFNPVSKQVILYFDKKLKNSTLSGLVIFDYREVSKPSVIFANYGKILIGQGNLLFRLIDGSRQATNEQGQIELMNFKDLIVNVQTQAVKRERTSTDIQEKYLNELFNPVLETAALRISKLRSEGHQRLAWPLFNVTLAIIALATIIPSPYNRRASLQPTLIACSVGILTVILNFTISNLSIKHPWLDFAIYLNIFMIILVAYNKIKEV